MAVELRFRLRLQGFLLEIDQTLESRSIAVVGHPGAGKSCLLKVIAGELTPEDGIITISGRVLVDSVRAIDIPSARRPVAYISPVPNIPKPLSTVSHNLEISALKPEFSDGPNLASVAECLELDSIMRRRIFRLEAGQRRLVTLACAIVRRPLLILFDEPLITFDSRRISFAPLLRRVTEELNIPLLFVSHNLYEVEAIAHSAMVLEMGRVAYEGPLGNLPWPRSTP